MRSHRERLADRLRCLIAAQEWNGPMEIEDAEDIANDLIDSAGLGDLLDDDPRHVIEFREDGWTIKHPMSCRPALFECPVNRAAERDLAEPPSVLGRFECRVHQHVSLDDRFVIGDSIDGYDTATVEDRRIQTDPPKRGGTDG